MLGASATIRNNIILGNSARIGGGIAVGASAEVLSPTPVIEGNVIRSNTARLDGAGIAIGDGEVIIRNNVFLENSVYADGAAIWILSNRGKFTIENNRFESNVAGDHGAGIYVGKNYSLTTIRITRNLFVHNRTMGTGFFGDTGSGAAIAALRVDGEISHNTLVENDGHHLTDCGGGGLLLYQTQKGLWVKDNIIVSNQQCGIACWWSPTTATMGPNVLWNNQGGNLGVGEGACPTDWADSIIVADPLFCDSESGDYRLATNSPARQGEEVMGAFGGPGCGPRTPSASGLWQPIGAHYED